jgi:basic membrane protein A and related proteins
VLDNVAQAQDAERVFRQLAAQGNKMIMGTTFSQYATLRKISTALKQSHFECCAGIETTGNLGVYEARSYEGTYLTGIAAGHMTKSNVLGWIGAFPVPQVLYNLNGFILGARSVNPDVTCKLIWVNAWSDPAKEKDAVNALVAQGVDVISGSPNTPVQGQAAEAKEVWSIGSSGDFSEYAPRKQLTSFVYDWSPAYIEPAKAILEGTWQPQARWRGLEAGGYVKMATQNPVLPEEVRKEMDEKQQAIAAGSFHPFTGPIKDQSGTLRVAEGAVISDAELRSVNWLVEGVQGSLPT